jgi:signal-transduction protein with cAMP-binding, CBS, and nucleotidyltransferase domain
MNARMVMRDSKASVFELAKVMVDWNVSSIAIADEEQNNKVIGILTERDIVKSIAKGASPDGITAGSLMSSPILSIRKDQPIEEAALIMIRNKVRHLLVEDPAVHNRAIIGIITTTDLARYLKKRMKETSITAASREDEKEEQQQQQQQQQSSSELLLSEVWELYF